jgi:T-complex protein 1 subunit gamma
LYWGIDGHTGKVANMQKQAILETFNVKSQLIKTAIESSCMLLRIDDIVSGIKKKEGQENNAPVHED